MERLSDIRLFLLVAEEEGFAKAARRAGLTAPVATRRIAALEEDLGARLFSRTTRRVSLTEAGTLYRDHASLVVEAAESAREALSDLGTKPKGPLRVTTSPTMGRELVRLMPEFLETYPEVQVGLHFSDRVVDLIRDGFDVAIRVGHPQDSSLIVRRLTTSNSVVCASPSYVAKHGEPLHPHDLAEHDCVLLHDRPGVKTWKFSANDEQISVRVTGSLALNSGDTVEQAAVAGLGIAMAPVWLLSESLRTGKLLPLLEKFIIEPSGTPINAVYPSRSFLPRKVRAFIDFLAEKFREDFASM
jgi:DNA-binding transcriptional LysR family regulator